MKYPTIYALSGGSEVVEVAIALAPKKYEWHRHGYDKVDISTQDDFNEDSAGIFDNPEVAEGYFGASSQGETKYKFDVIEGASESQISDYKKRIQQSLKK